MSSSNEVSAEKRVAELESQVKELMAMMRANLSEKETVNKNSSYDSSEDIRLDKMIPIISLIPYELSLMQLQNGKPKYKFNHFGDVKLVLYQEVITLIEMYRHFMENGYFYIDNLQVVERHGLSGIYSKILDKVKIEEILECKSVNAVNLYRLATDGQRRMIDEFIIGKIRDSSEDVSKLFDMNFLREISNMSGTDVVKKAQDAKDIIDNIAKEDEIRKNNMK